MKKYLLFCFLLTASMLVRGQVDTTLTDIQNRSMPVDSFYNRKALVILMPIQPDSGFAGQLLRFRARHAGNVNIVVLIPGGAMRNMMTTDTGRLDSLSSAGIFLSQGLKKAAGTGRWGPLLCWLTNKSENRSAEVLAPGRKYFISEAGQIYAQLDPNDSLDGPMADLLINMTVPVTKLN